MSNKKTTTTKQTVFTDKDFSIGKGEADIRQLSRANKDQLSFRVVSNELALLNGIHQTLIDLSTILMLIAKKLGVEDIVKELDNLQDELSKSVQSKVKVLDPKENKA